MNGYQFMSDHPFMTLVLAFMALSAFEMIIKFLIMATRHTERCDADGGFNKPSEGGK